MVNNRKLLHVCTHSVYGMCDEVCTETVESNYRTAQDSRNHFWADLHKNDKGSHLLQNDESKRQKNSQLSPKKLQRNREQYYALHICQTVYCQLKIGIWQNNLLYLSSKQFVVHTYCVTASTRQLFSFSICVQNEFFTTSL